MDEKTIPETIWVEYEADTRSYYYNKETKQTTWDLPAAYSAWKENAVKGYLKTTNWRKAVDAKQKVYYYDKLTKKTQWSVPTDVTDFEVQLVKLNLQRHVSRKRKVESVAVEGEGEGAVKTLPTVPLFDQTTASQNTKLNEIPRKIKKKSLDVDLDDDIDVMQEKEKEKERSSVGVIDSVTTEPATTHKEEAKDNYGEQEYEESQDQEAYTTGGTLTAEDAEWERERGSATPTAEDAEWERERGSATPTGDDEWERERGGATPTGEDDDWQGEGGSERGSATPNGTPDEYKQSGEGDSTYLQEEEQEEDQNAYLKRQENEELLRVLDDKLTVRDSLMELSVEDTIRQCLQPGINPLVR